MCGSNEFVERPLHAAGGQIYSYGTTLVRRFWGFLLALGVSQDLEHSTSTLPLRCILSPFQLHPYQPPKPNTHSLSHQEMGLNTQTKTCEELGTIEFNPNLKRYFWQLAVPKTTTINRKAEKHNCGNLFSRHKCSTQCFIITHHAPLVPMNKHSTLILPTYPLNCQPPTLLPKT